VHLVYHGTTLDYAKRIWWNGIDLTIQRTGTDFGQGFYTATQWGQARAWAREAARLFHQRHSRPSPPAIAVFSVDPIDWKQPSGCRFPAWPAPSLACALLVRRCRTGHLALPHPYTWIYGPTYRGPWTAPKPWQGMDQFSVHTKLAAQVLDQGRVGVWQEGGNGPWLRVI